MTLARYLQPLVLSCALVALAACGGGKDSSEASAGEGNAMKTIEGEVYYRERMLLPPGVEVEVQLQDISRADAPASVMASVMFKPESGPPWPFSIEYDPAQIDSRGRYGLRATVSLAGKLMFTSTEYIDPFATQPVKILVYRVPGAARSAPAADPNQPVAAVAGQTPSTGQGSAAADGDAQGSGNTWVLQTLNGEPAPAGAGGVPVELVLDADKHSVAGFSGCNRYSGSFTDEGDSTHGTPLSFGPLASTMRACLDGGELERLYLDTLGRVDAYRMRDDKLELLAGSEVVATFGMP